jgi:hypothetical protein
MLAPIRTRAVAAVAAVSVCRRVIANRTYYSSSNGSDSLYGSNSTGGYSVYSSVQPISSYEPQPAATASDNGVVAPLSCMNRNARKPGPANHGARPNSNYNRKVSSPEFGSWRHVGLRPGQTPKPRPQPGTPSCVAEVATLSDATKQQPAKKQ